MAHDMLYNDMN